MIYKKGLKKFKEIYERQFDKKLSNKEVCKKSESLLKEVKLAIKKESNLLVKEIKL